jgi:hypothetical protein
MRNETARQRSYDASGPKVEERRGRNVVHPMRVEMDVTTRIGALTDRRICEAGSATRGRTHVARRSMRVATRLDVLTGPVERLNSDASPEGIRVHFVRASF